MFSPIKKGITAGALLTFSSSLVPLPISEPPFPSFLPSFLSFRCHPPPLLFHPPSSAL